MKVNRGVLTLGIMVAQFITLFLFSCPPPVSQTPPADAPASIFPDLTKELPTKASDASRAVTAGAVEAYFGGRPNGDMEWHSYVMLQGMNDWGTQLNAALTAAGGIPVEPGKSAECTLQAFDFMNTRYESMRVTCAFVASETPYYLVEGFSGSTQVIRYAAIKGTDGDLSKGHFVWVNALEYTQTYDPATQGPHAKELVEIHYDLSDPQAKKLRVDTVHARLQLAGSSPLRHYGFILKSTYNETAKTGTGQYVDDQPMNFMISYDMNTLNKTIAEYDETADAISSAANFDSTGALVSGTATFSLAGLGFTPLEQSDVPLTYENPQGTSRAEAVMGNWATAVSEATIGM